MASARLFGSYARQEATAESDIDVLVHAGDGDPFDVLAVAEDLYRATGKSVDGECGRFPGHSLRAGPGYTT